jgi:two-component system cell cycle sensor histidine kinase/response regulator CckA
MSGVDYPRLLRFARELQRAVDYATLLDVVRVAVADLTRYEHCWLAVFEPDQTHARILAYAGGDHPVDWEKARLIPIEGDAMLEEIQRAQSVVVVEDARVDPRTNKTLVEALGSRTIINVPLSLLDVPIGALGIGTFAGEGVLRPTDDELHGLMAIAGQVAVAAGRLRWLREQAQAELERADLNRRLAQAQRLESLGLLAGGVAHDFNNVLQIVLSHASLLDQHPLEEQQRADVRNIVEAAERGAGLSRQLLAMGRRQAQRLEAVQLNDRLRALMHLLTRTIPANIEVELIEGTNLPPVFGDPTQLDQVFLNLALNARDAMPNGGRLTLESEQVLLNGAYVRAHPWAKPGRYVLTSVTDNGTGMAPEILEHIFDPFFSTKGSQGTGLGLAIAYGIVTQHGGLIHAYSEPGVGTSFKIYLPFLEREAATIDPKLPTAVPGGHERVLVAEDDPRVRDVIRRILAEAGYEVRLVADGEEAVAAALTAPAPDLVVLDAMMPKMSGHQACRAIQAAGVRTAFLFSSGYAAERLPAELLAATRAELLQKPYDPEQLLRAVRAALDRACASAP